MKDPIRLEDRRLRHIERQLRPRAARLVARTALSVTLRSIRNTPPRVDTGAMINGWQATRLGDLSWIVSNPVEYTIYHEYGTSRMSAHPMLGPAVEAERITFASRVGELFR